MANIHDEVQQCYTTMAREDPRFKKFFLSRYGFYKANEETESGLLYHEVINSNEVGDFPTETLRDRDFRFGICPSCLKALNSSKPIQKPIEIIGASLPDLGNIIFYFICHD